MQSVVLCGLILLQFSVLCSGNYTFHDGDFTWDQARRACRNMTAHLVTMETTAEWNTVKEKIAEKVKGDKKNHHWFIGLRMRGTTWKWTEGVGGPKSVVADYDERWQSGEPSCDFSEPCGEIQSNYRREQGHFNNVICNKKPSNDYPRGYICEHGI